MMSTVAMIEIKRQMKRAKEWCEEFIRKKQAAWEWQEGILAWQTWEWEKGEIVEDDKMWRMHDWMERLQASATWLGEMTRWKAWLNRLRRRMLRQHEEVKTGVPGQVTIELAVVNQVMGEVMGEFMEHAG